MLENKTANNIVDRYHRIITGDQSQIETGIQPEGTIEITQNGEVDVTEYETAKVNVAGASNTMIPYTLTNNTGATIQGANFDKNGRYINTSSFISGYIPLTSSGSLDSPVCFIQTGRKLDSITATATDDKNHTLRVLLGKFDFSNANVLYLGLYYASGTYNGTQISITLS